MIIIVALNVVKDAITRLLKDTFPNFRVFVEDPDLTKTPLFLLDIIPGGNVTSSIDYTDRSVMFNIGCLTKEKTKHGYYDIADKLDGALRPVFRFADRAITVKQAGWRVVDDMMHYTFSIDFRDCFDTPEAETVDLTGELNLNIKRSVT